MKDDSKFFNILIFFGIDGRCLKYRFSKKIIKIVSFFFLSILFSFIIFSTILLNDYFSKIKDLDKFSFLREKSIKQKKIIDLFSQKINNIENQLDKLEVLDKKFKQIIAEGETIDDTDLDKDKIFSKKGDSFDQLYKRVKTRLISFQGINASINEQRQRLQSIPSIWPSKGWVTSNFGYRKSPFTGLREVHEGLDIAAIKGSPIVAPADGIVVKTGVENGYGNIIKIDHGYGIETKYGHNEKNFVKIGEKVKRGQLIGTVGQTGITTGAHLHYEVLLNGVPVNPSKFILND